MPFLALVTDCKYKLDTSKGKQRGKPCNLRDVGRKTQPFVVKPNVPCDDVSLTIQTEKIFNVQESTPIAT